MTARRFKVWLLVAPVATLMGVYVGIFLAGFMKKNAIYTGTDGPFPANESVTLARVHAATSLAAGVVDENDTCGSEESALSFGSTRTSGSDNISGTANTDPAIVNVSAANHTVLKEYARATTVRMLQDTSGPVCDVPQPVVPDFCGKQSVEGINATYRRAASAVGHLEIDEDHIACSGVQLDGDSKTHAYFLTAAHCLPNEDNVGRARIHFVDGCVGVNTYTKNTVYAINRRLGYVIFRVEANVKDIRAGYGYLHLNAATQVVGEQVFIAHNSANSAVQLITDQVHGSAIKIEEYVGIQGCVVDAPKSRVSYIAPRMDRVAAGAPVVRTVDGTIVALHLCGDCSVSSQNNALRSYTILVDLDIQALSIPSFAQ